MKMLRQQVPLILAAAFAVNGCAANDALSKRVTGFSSALVDTTDGVSKSFATVEDYYRQTQVDDLVVNYALGKNVVPEPKPKLFPPEALQARLDVLQGLDSYAKLLAELVDGTTRSELSDADQKVAENLKKLTDASFKVAGKQFSRSDQVAAGVGAAANKIGNLIIERKVKRKLPPIIEGMNDEVKKVAELLDADIGAPGRSGLRDIVRTAARGSREARDLLLRVYLPQKSGNQQTTCRQPLIGPDVVRSEVKGMLDTESEIDAVLVATQASLRKMAAAHQALVDAPDKDKVSVDIAVKQFVKEADSINDYYKKLIGDLKNK